MRKLVAVLTVLIGLAAPALASAEGPFLVRLRGVYIIPADKSDAAGEIPKDAITVSKKLIPEIDFSYFFTPNLSAELILTYPQKHDVELDGTKIGTVTHLPPVLAAQWHFLPGGMVNPYVGVGVNLTLITAQDLADGVLEIDKSSIGVAGQVGADVKITDQIFANVDVKYVTMGFDVNVKETGDKITSISLSPWLLGAGVGYRF